MTDKWRSKLEAKAQYFQDHSGYYERWVGTADAWDILQGAVAEAIMNDRKQDVAIEAAIKKLRQAYASSRFEGENDPEIALNLITEAIDLLEGKYEPK